MVRKSSKPVSTRSKSWQLTQLWQSNRLKPRTTKRWSVRFRRTSILWIITDQGKSLSWNRVSRTCESITLCKKTASSQPKTPREQAEEIRTTSAITTRVMTNSKYMRSRRHWRKLECRSARRMKIYLLREGLEMILILMSTIELLRISSKARCSVPRSHRIQWERNVKSQESCLRYRLMRIAK